MSTLRVNNLTNQANDGGIEFAVQPVIDGLCKAWVNFNGTGTVAIRDSYNVSSITDNATGDYTVNFTTALPDANYVQNVTASFAGGAYAETTVGLNFTSSFATQAPTASNFRFCLGYPRGNTFIDQAYVAVTIHR
jgi:hypothetical protein